MKVLKWLWFIVLAALGFKLYGFFVRASTNDFSGNYAGEMNSFVGMVLIFLAITAILIISWVFGRAKGALVKKSAE
jgi:hypothetical protein